MAILPKILSVREIAELIGDGITTSTVRTFLDGWRFSKFRTLTNNSINKPVQAYRINQDFLNVLCSYLLDKNPKRADSLENNLTKLGITVEYCSVYKTN